MDAELVIRGGTIVTAHGRLQGGVAVTDGCIVAVGPDASLPDAAEVIDATGLVVLPGVIYTHTHARDPSRNEREDFATATAAAAAGGITTILEMPISTPSVHSRGTLEARLAAVRPKAHVDFGLYGGAAGDNHDEIAGLAAAGAVGFKTFRTPVPAGRDTAGDSPVGSTASSPAGAGCRRRRRPPAGALPAAVPMEGRRSRHDRCTPCIAAGRGVALR